MGGVRTPITFDDATQNCTFGHFFPVLVDIDKIKKLHLEILVERDGFALMFKIYYEKLTVCYDSCKTMCTIYRDASGRFKKPTWIQIHGYQS